jgi:hypothetical protein
MRATGECAQGAFDVRPQYECGDVCAVTVGKNGAKLGVGGEGCERGNAGWPSPYVVVIERVGRGRLGTERGWSWWWWRGRGGGFT